MKAPQEQESYPHYSPPRKVPGAWQIVEFAPKPGLNIYLPETMILLNM
jgi:hypothetical protein